MDTSQKPLIQFILGVFDRLFLLKKISIVEFFSTFSYV